jgi:hypothetical protein
MTPHMHDDTTQEVEQLPPPVESKSIATPLVERPSQPTPTTSRRWIGILLTILGILLPLAGWPWYRLGYEGDFIPPLPFVGTVLSLVVGAALLRSWWAVLIVPAVWSAGSALAGYILQPFIWGWDCTLITLITCPGAYSPGLPAVQAMLGSGLLWRGLGFLLLPLLACAALGAGIGVALSNWLKKP